MSIFRTINVKCPVCQENVSVSVVGSVNADRRPDLREAILNDAFQDTTCGSCEKSFRLQPNFNYLDVKYGIWIAAMPADKFPRYLKYEDQATALFAESYGDDAPPAAQAVGKKLDLRVTFGWPAVREKLLTRVEGIDDTALEIMKLDLLRKLPSAPLAPGVELRLVYVTALEMEFLWLRTDTEEALEGFRTPRTWYDLILSDPDPWSPVKSQLVNGPFVDMQKTYMGPGRSAAE